ncbi:S-adenosyl-L-methionine-dependent methyltransferase [Serendipita vermifera]|nr:S-adenosyl-L-methionine-dependent methyltransferase [Serendipita vermifera]
MTRKKQKTTSLLSSLPQELRDMFTSKKKVSSDQVQVEEAQASERPAKRQRKEGLLPQKLEKYDATGLAPFYTDVGQVPSHLKKYFYQRHRMFSRYSEGCLLDEEGWYSVTPEKIADQIAERCRCDVIIDAFCGVGGNAIAFAKTCERVIAIDNSPVRLALARHNAALYGVVDRIEFVLADFVTFATAFAKQPTRQKVDVVFLSPPWGGIDYQSFSPSKSSNLLVTPNTTSKSALPSSSDAGQGALEIAYEDESNEQSNYYSLGNMKPLPGNELFKLARRITPHVAFYLPRNQDLEEVSNLVTLVSPISHGGGYSNPGRYVGEMGTTARRGQSGANHKQQDRVEEFIEVEEEWMGSKIKALTCYFGGLVQGQEHLWR